MSAEQDRADERSTELQADLRIFLMRWVRKHKVGSWEGIAALALELANMANGNDIDPDQVILSFIECHNRTFPRHAIACNFEEPHAPPTPVSPLLNPKPFRPVLDIPCPTPGCIGDIAHNGPCHDETGRFGPLVLAYSKGPNDA
jgi:hypothetical protein